MTSHKLVIDTNSPPQSDIYPGAHQWFGSMRFTNLKHPASVVVNNNKQFFFPCFGIFLMLLTYALWGKP